MLLPVVQELLAIVGVSSREEQTRDSSESEGMKT
jgi:hypothetical protein